MPIHGYPGNVITANPVAPTSTVATGVWTTEQQLKAVAAGNWPFTIPTQQISRSLRFNSADTPSLSRTPGSAGNRQKFTISVWYKACGISTSQSNANIINAGGDGSSLLIAGTAAFGATYDNRLLFREAGTTLFYWPMVFRDPSAWYHIVFAMDTTQATAANRAKLYVNGVDQGAFSGTAISQNTSTSINNTSAHSIGLFNNVYPNNLYYAEYYLIDGQQLTPASFGRNNVETGVWEPLAYTGTYGTNGFYVNFSDNSNTTAATLGKDYSGNGNNWTPNNFSVTAGAGNDSMVDSPTSYGTDTGVGGEVRGNYCTLNPLNVNNAPTLSNGNLDFAGSTSNSSATAGTIGISSGKWYWEVLVTNTSALGIGIFNATVAPSLSTIYDYENDGRKRTGGVASSYGASFTTNDIIGVALDLDGGTLVFYKNNTSQGTAFSGLAGTLFVAGILDVDNAPSATCSINFGQRAFAYTAPSGFKALCTQNFTTPTIGATSTTQAANYFAINTYAGTGATNVQTVGFAPDFVWIKARTNAYWHKLFDKLRGANKPLVSNDTTAELTETQGLMSFDSNGFTLGTSSDSTVNNAGSGQTYVAWNWKANGAGSSNTAGTITSTVSANTTAGFSISTYTGNGSSSQTVGHGLGVTPGMVIIKTRSNSDNWRVWHTSLTSGQTLTLNSTAAQAASGFWPSNPSTSVVYLGTDTSVNSNTWTYVMYSFAPVAGYSAFGSYTGNSSSDGPFVYLGFRPRYVMVKRFTGAGGVWEILDSSRDPYNAADKSLRPNASDAEATGVGPIDFLSNGFKLRGIGGQTNDSGTYLYAAFAESPFKYSLAR
jgi:hypothetical protein